MRDIVEAKGTLLAYYYSDLCYFDAFQKVKKGIISHTEYLDKKQIHSFSRFLWEFRVIRNTNAKEQKVPILLKETVQWCKGEDARDVEAFKMRIRRESLVHNKDMTSLSSKILFLNSPSIIMPYDRFVKKAVDYNLSNYNDFVKAIKQYKLEFAGDIEKLSKQVASDLNRIEKVFLGDSHRYINVSRIRQNRILDKLLWTVGKNYG
jgi:hypothetical protein